MKAAQDEIKRLQIGLPVSVVLMQKAQGLLKEAEQKARNENNPLLTRFFSDSWVSQQADPQLVKVAEREIMRLEMAGVEVSTNEPRDKGIDAARTEERQVPRCVFSTGLADALPIQLNSSGSPCACACGRLGSRATALGTTFLRWFAR